MCICKLSWLYNIVTENLILLFFFRQVVNNDHPVIQESLRKQKCA